MAEVTAETVRYLFNYDADSGIFTRRVRTANCTRVGQIAGSMNGDGYLFVRVNGKSIAVSRLAWLYTYGAWPSNIVDHINGVRSDNRISNLRECTNAENSQNRRRPRGVYRSACNGFVSFVTVAGKRHYLGHFKTSEAAQAAYSIAKSKLHPFQTLGNLPA